MTMSILLPFTVNNIQNFKEKIKGKKLGENQSKKNIKSGECVKLNV